MEREKILEKLAQAIVNGDKDQAVKASQEALEAGIDPLDAIHRGGMKGMDAIGKRFECLEAFLPNLILAADAMKACVDLLRLKISPERASEVSSGKVIIGTVYGDVHDIGKNMVGVILSVNGFEVYDLGVNVPTKKFVEKAEEVGADIIGLSSLMSTSAYYQKDLIDYLSDSGLRSKYFIIVGGGPVTPAWAVNIKADGYARMATGAPTLCRRLMDGIDKPPLEKPLSIIN